MKKIWIAIVIIVAAALAITLFVTKTQKGTEKIKIGVILPLTGDGASLGEDCKNGIELAVDIFNLKGYIDGKKIVVSYEDSEGKPDLAVNALHKFITQGIRIVIGDLFSSPTLAMAPIADKNEILLFSPGASSPKLSGISKYFFRNYPSDNYEGKLIAEYIYQQGIKRTAILYPNNDYGVGLKDVFKGKYEYLGGRIVFNEGYDENSTDFRTSLAKIQTEKPEALYLPGYYSSIARITRQIKELGIKIRLFSNIGVEDPKIFELAGNAAYDLVYTAPAIDFKSNAPAIKDFVEKFKQRFGREPGFPSAHGYDSINFLMQSMLKSQRSEPDSIAKVLLDMEFDGVTGSRIKFQASGDVIKPFYIKKIGTGEFLRIGEIKEAME